MRRLPIPDVDEVENWVSTELDGLFTGVVRRSEYFMGGQTAADRALAGLDIDGYSKQRSQVHPLKSRGASKLSPYIRHGLLDLPLVHDHSSVAEANSYDRFRFRGELLWQDYSRQWYAVFGEQTKRGIIYQPQPGKSAATWDRAAWPTEMRCIEATLDELHRDGWMVNQTRMWLASQWSVRAGADWGDGDDEMFRHLLDGSRAANRQGWQWVVGGVRNRSYGFARRQVMKRASEYCAQCALSDACPIGGYPGSVSGPMIDPAPTIRSAALRSSAASEHVEPEAVWITAESLGDADPAMRAHPDLPVHFVFDEPLLTSLRLDAKRLVFLTDCLADLGQRRDLQIWRGRPSQLLDAGGSLSDGPRALAVTDAPVPGFERLRERATTPLRLAPWRWLRAPTPALMERLEGKRFPSFKDWCRLTKPATNSRPAS